MVLIQLLCILQVAGAAPQEAPKSEPSRTFSRAIAGIGDTNGDQVPDFLVSDPGKSGEPYGNFQEHGERGRVWLLSGKDGSTLRMIAAEHLDDGFGWSLDDVGDLNRDGVHDWIVGVIDRREGKVGHAIVFCGQTGSVLLRVKGENPGEIFGQVVAGVNDLDADGVPDFAVGCPNSDARGPFTGRLYFYSGSDGSLLFRLDGAAAREQLGWTVVPVGDVDRDGHSDVAISRRMKSERDVIQLISGDGGAILWTSDPMDCWSLQSGMDYDGDKTLDLIVGGYESVTLLSGQDGHALNTWTGTVTGPLRVLGDVNADGALDFLAADHTWIINSGRVQLLSSRDGEELYAVDVDGNSWHFGNAMDTVGDVDGDGVLDFAVGVDATLAGGLCHVWLWSGRTGAALWEVKREGDKVVRVDPTPEPPKDD